MFFTITTLIVVLLIFAILSFLFSSARTSGFTFILLATFILLLFSFSSTVHLLKSSLQGKGMEISTRVEAENYCKESQILLIMGENLPHQLIMGPNLNLRMNVLLNILNTEHNYKSIIFSNGNDLYSISSHVMNEYFKIYYGNNKKNPEILLESLSKNPQMAVNEVSKILVQKHPAQLARPMALTLIVQDTEAWYWERFFEKAQVKVCPLLVSDVERRGEGLLSFKNGFVFESLFKILYEVFKLTFF